MDDTTQTPGVTPTDPMATPSPATDMPVNPVTSPVEPTVPAEPTAPAMGETPAVPAADTPVEEPVAAPMGVPGSEPAEDPTKPAI